MHTPFTRNKTFDTTCIYWTFIDHVAAGFSEFVNKTKADVVIIVMALDMRWITLWLLIISLGQTDDTLYFIGIKQTESLNR